ncbi:MAG TPA: 16S rRNA (cytosine(967)-C(5))-methyltransferase RsmB [Gemmatimonadaceae bacterium]|nr:16S rRNA (cytosine(967)-C(5))-methyltransferase RsmB [Gemmatimonadaceae bacterium]
MGVTASRIAVAEVFQDLRSGELLDSSFEKRISSLDDRDRRWAHELAYGILRRRAWLDSLLTERVRGGLARLDPDLADLLRAGAYQLLHMRSVPPYAAIAQTVELAKTRHGLGASKLVNAVLRRLDRERDNLSRALPPDPIEALVVTHSHPRWLIQRWVARYGMTDTVGLLEANNVEPPTYVRPFNVVREQLEAALEADGLEVEDAPLVRDSVRLPQGTALTELAAFQQGQLFVQDPAATLVTQYAAIAPGSVVADLCAAPGGKTLELARGAAQVVASDRSMLRLSRLAENMQRVDATGIELVLMDARTPALRQVDAVLLDAPCSGTGTFRRHPDARWRLKASDISVMASTQRSLLDAAANVVKPGGLLVYSTCSLEPEENDQPVDLFLATHPQFVLEPPPAGAVPSEVLDNGRLRVLPHRHGADGSFAVRLRRT